MGKATNPSKRNLPMIPLATAGAVGRAEVARGMSLIVVVEIECEKSEETRGESGFFG